MDDRWEQGSEFHWPDVEAVPRAARHPWGAAGRFFGSGRDALRSLLAHGRRERGWRRLWIPAYFCQEVVAAMLSTGLEGVPYPDGPDDGPLARLDWSFARGDVLFLVNHFGLRAPPALAGLDRAVVEIIEDHTHDPWSAWAFGSVADFAVASLRKPLPLPDGGVLWSPRNEPLPDQPPVSETRRRAAQNKRAGMILKADYLCGRAIPKERYRALLLAGEREIASGRPSGMTEESRAMLNRFPAASWRAIRQENQRYLAEHLAQAHGVRVLAAVPSGSCPFSTILVFDTAQQRETVRRLLIEQRIFPAVLWPLENASWAELPPAYCRLSARLLSLHCDMRYSRSDLTRVARTILDMPACQND